MKKSSCGIAIEGIPFIVLNLFSSLICAMSNYIFLSAFFLLLAWFSSYFFRDPERICPNQSGIAVSPADGRVVKIEKVIAPFIEEERICISIFMSLFDVHVNRIPIYAKIKDIHYYPGKFFNASLDKASQYNERCAYLLEGKDGDFVMVQIAGLIAQRIVCRAEIGDVLNAGDRFGMIKFGSRLDLYLPESYVPSINIGDNVLAGQSILGKISTKQD